MCLLKNKYIYIKQKKKKGKKIKIIILKLEAFKSWKNNLIKTD